MTSLMVPASGTTPSSLLVATPVPSDPGINVVITKVITVTYTGSQTTELVLFSSLPRPGSNNGVLVVEVPVSPSRAPTTSQPPPAHSSMTGTNSAGNASPSPTYFYIGDSTLAAVSLPGNPPTTIIATPASNSARITPLVTASSTLAYFGSTTRSYYIFSSSPTDGIDPALLIVETPAQPVASSIFYLGSSITYITLPATGGPPASTITANPVSNNAAYTPIVTSSTVVPYTGSVPQTITLFSTSPTVGQDPAFAIVFTPFSAPTSSYYYLGGSTTTTLSFPQAGTTPAYSIIATPAPTNAGITPSITRTISVQWTGLSTQSLTVFQSAPSVSDCCCSNTSFKGRSELLSHSGSSAH